MIVGGRAPGRRPAPRLAAVVLASAAWAIGGFASPAALAQGLRTIDAAAAPAGTYRLDKARSSIVLRVSHAGLSYTVLRVDRFDGALDYDPAHPERSKIDVTLEAGSLDSGDPGLDRLFSDGALDATRYPRVHFVAREIRPTIEGRAQVRGDLTLRDQTRPVDLDVLFNGAAEDDRRSTRLGFSANATLDLSAFGVARLDPGVGNQMSVDIEVEFKS